MQPNPISNVIRIVVWALAGAIVVLALGFTVTAVTLPGCTLCHRSDTFVTQTAQSAHKSIACARCHVEPGVAPRLTYAYHMIFGMTLRAAPINSGSVAAVSNGTCLSCHSDVMTHITTSHGLSIDHSKCSLGRLCTDCHSDTAHGTAVRWLQTADMNKCLDCHNSARVRANCNTCHATRTELSRLQTGEWLVTHGSSWKQTHGMGDLNTCLACHPDDFCARCHHLSLPHGPDFLRQHPAFALTQRQDCAVCHRQTFCDTCHQLPMPHPADFTPSHPTIVQQRGQAVCLRCHVQDDCTNCHIKHVHPGGATLPPRSGL